MKTPNSLLQFSLFIILCITVPSSSSHASSEQPYLLAESAPEKGILDSLFSHLEELKEGENSIVIKASDKAGNTSKKDITVFRKSLGYSSLPKDILSNRMRIAVFPFDQKGTVTDVSNLFQDMLTSALLNRNRFQVIERDGLDMILKEQNLSSTKLVDQNTAVNLGKLMAVQTIIHGSIIENHMGIEIVGRMIDTETAEILATEKVFYNTRDLASLNFMAEAMAVKFHDDFPVFQGIVIKRKGKNIFTDLGEDKVSLHRRLIVYREKGSSENEILGHARVIQVLPDMSKAELISGSIEDINALDKVIVQ